MPKLVGAESSDLKIRAHRGFPQWWLDFWDRTHSGQGACGTALGWGERVIVEHVERARFSEGPLLSKCRLGQAYEWFSPPPSFPLRENPQASSRRITENRIDRMSAYCNCWTCSPAKGRMSSSVPRWGHLMCESEERFRALVIASSDVVYRMSAYWTGVLTNTGQPVRYFPRQPTSLQGQSP